jgi:hypothetical protein
MGVLVRCLPVQWGTSTARRGQPMKKLVAKSSPHLIHGRKEG